MFIVHLIPNKHMINFACYIFVNYRFLLLNNSTSMSTLFFYLLYLKKEIMKYEQLFNFIFHRLYNFHKQIGELQEVVSITFRQTKVLRDFFAIKLITGNSGKRSDFKMELLLEQMPGSTDSDICDRTITSQIMLATEY